MSACPALRPRGTLTRLLIHARMLPSAGNTASASATHLSRLNYTAYRSPLYASQPGLPQGPGNTRFRLPARFAGQDCLPTGSQKFLLPNGGFPSFQALPGAHYQMKAFRSGLLWILCFACHNGWCSSGPLGQTYHRFLR